MNAQTTAKQTSKMSQIGKTRYMVQVAMLGAAAVVLMFFDIPLPFAPSFYKIDLSEVPVLIGAFAMGPLAGAAIELIKILLNLVMKGSTTAGVGEVANFHNPAVTLEVIDGIEAYMKKNGFENVKDMVGIVK